YAKLYVACCLFSVKLFLYTSYFPVLQLSSQRAVLMIRFPYNIHSPLSLLPPISQCQKDRLSGHNHFDTHTHTHTHAHTLSHTHTHTHSHKHNTHSLRYSSHTPPHSLSPSRLPPPPPSLSLSLSLSLPPSLSPSLKSLS